MVQRPARSANYYMGSIAQRCALPPQRPAAIQQRHAHLLRRSQSSHYSGHLYGQFTGGQQHKRLDLSERRVAPFYQRRRERQRLSGPCTRLANQVSSCHEMRYGLLLNGCGTRNVHPGNHRLGSSLQGHFGKRRNTGRGAVKSWLACSRRLASVCTDHRRRSMATEIEAWAAIRRLAPAWAEGEGCGFAAFGANGLVPCAAGWARVRRRKTISHNENGLPIL